METAAMQYIRPMSVDNGLGQLYVEGFVFGVNNKLIPATVQVVVNATGAPLTQPLTVADGSYSAWINVTDRYTNAVKFSSPGYQDKTVQFSILENTPDVTLEKGTGGLIQPWQIVVVGAAIAIYMQKEKKKGRKVGFLSTGDIMPIFLLVGGVIGFSLIKAILEKLGLWDSKDTKDLDEAASDPNSFWNPNYWQTIKPANAGWTYAITQAQANQWAGEIYNSFGAWNDCEECVKAVFRRCRTKANVSFLCWEFNNRYGFDLLDFLRGGNWPQDRLSDSDVNEINQFVSSLPKY